jgi:nitrogen regulatory protein P-II 1
MKKIEAVIQPFKLDEIKEALAKEKLARISILEVKGAGSQQGKLKQYRGTRYIEDSANVKLEMIVADDDAEPLAEMIVTILRSGDLCDGEVIITPVECLFRVRVGQPDCTGAAWQPAVAPSCLGRNKTTFRTHVRSSGESVMKQTETIIKALKEILTRSWARL